MNEHIPEHYRYVHPNEYQTLIKEEPFGVICLSSYDTYEEARDAFRTEIEKRPSPFKFKGITQKPEGFFARMQTPDGLRHVGPFEFREMAEASMLRFIAKMTQPTFQTL
jgi:hypothetical protein